MLSFHTIRPPIRALNQPQIIMNKGHTSAADWWALGVLVFELCNGLPPFMDEDRLAMFRKICAR